MDNSSLINLIYRIKQNEITVEAALEEIRKYYYEDIGHAKIDHHRILRNGMPEVIFGLGKTPEQVADIARGLKNKGSKVLVTRAGEEHYAAVKALIPQAEYYKTAGLITSEKVIAPGGEKVAVLTAGTADISVAQEAALSLEFFGTAVARIFDVGVAGLHRLADKMEDIRACRAVIVVAGMDGALPSVVAGMVDLPVIAVPTSIGYGASFSGLAPLLAMLNSCAAGVGVVNIDNGFGAAALAHAILRSGGSEK